MDVGGASPFVTWLLTDLGNNVFNIQNSAKVACGNTFSFLSTAACSFSAGSNVVDLYSAVSHPNPHCLGELGHM